MEEIMKMLSPLVTFVVGGLVTWVWHLWVSHNNHKLEVVEKSKNYVTHDQLNSVKSEIMKEFRFLRDLTLRISHALNIKAPGEGCHE